LGLLATAVVTDILRVNYHKTLLHLGSSTFLWTEAIFIKRSSA